ncbi:MAG: CCA tRNA nucleotidyltransferase [Nitrospirota bacterium]
MNALISSLLQQIASLTSQPVYLVGGSVRDLAAGTENIKDIDLVMPSGSEDVARAFADRIGGSFFVLDEERMITRVVKREPESTLQFDFTNFEGADLAADLARRDFTVNAMAMDLRGFLETGTLAGIVDPFDGRADVHQKLIRVSDPKVLDDDPLRLLRAARFAATLGYSIERSTAEHIKGRADLIARPSAERVRDELFQILSVPGAGRHLLLLESLGLLNRLLPELDPLKDFSPGKHHLYDIFTHSLKAAEYVDSILADLSLISPGHAATVHAHLDSELEQFVTRRAALRFACLLHDNAKSETYSRDDEGDIHFFGHDSIGADKALFICQRFRLSNDASSVVSRLIRHHMRPLNLSAPGGPSRRALYRYCRDLKDAVPESVVLSLADARATAEVMPAEGFTDTRAIAGQILDYYYGKFLKTEAKPFVTGKDLIARGLKPGPRFREILDDLKERQAEGAIRDRQEALACLASLAPGG